MIAFLGMGLLGSNFVRALRRNGHEVRVWNRSPARAEAVAAETGAQAFADPAEAVRGATRVHLTLSDDASVDDVLERARPGLASGAVLVDHTTTSASGTQARILRWKERGVQFVHAPVFMGPQNARESTGIMLVSGDAAGLDPLRPALEKMTGKLVHAGARPEAAASMKLLGNMFLMFLTSGLADMLSLAKALGVSPDEAAELFKYFNPGATVGARMARMTGGNFSEPSWELVMARKDARLMQEEAARAGVPLAVLPAIAQRMDEVIAQGHGHADWTVLGKDALPK
jgi:3-hydroxyisobutyrate dehydrogenase